MSNIRITINNDGKYYGSCYHEYHSISKHVCTLFGKELETEWVGSHDMQDFFETPRCQQCTESEI